MTLSKTTASILGIAFGTFLIIYGGMDDSPGAQILGLILILSGIVGVIRRKKKDDCPPPA